MSNRNEVMMNGFFIGDYELTKGLQAFMQPMTRDEHHNELLTEPRDSCIKILFIAWLVAFGGWMDLLID